ncbi:MAG: hypothetical protein RLZZ457_1963 [Pseudomonadota bacterium]
MDELSPNTVSTAELTHALTTQGYGVLQAAQVAQWAHCDLAALQALSPDWADMPADNYLKDGGRYRRRRHSSFVCQGNALSAVAHRAHWQSLDYNALHGGMERWFEPMHPTTVHSPAWTQLLTALAHTASEVRGTPDTRWCIEAHQFRIDTTNGIGRPTPEGAHRDGVDFVAVFMVNRVGIKGGETRVFDAHGPQGERFTLSEPWSLLLLDDTRVIHETTPIQPMAEGGYRDTLVLTCRADKFQDAEPSV